jgi:spermidine synthase
VYAINTIGSVSGSLAAGFLLIPWLGLQSTLRVVCACLVGAVLLVAAWGRLPKNTRLAAVLATAASAVIVGFSPPWDRDLLASGAYLYASFVPRDLDLDTLLKAGTLLYYRDGASATVSVKRLTGTTTLAVDGKTDASNRGDMLTQKLVAHLPLLVHDNPRDVAVIGLGSGVTLGSALRHPIARADVLEISPEVVEASAFFAAENHRALDDPRTNVIVGDGRSHLMLSRRQYDVIISEPSNPWIAGVASLFTHEFFLGARERLSADGVICQWANAYNISDRDLRSIVGTFRSVFPNGTVWLVGTDDVLMLGSRDDAPLDARLQNIERYWTRPGVSADLAEVLAMNPFSLWSLYVGGPEELARYAGDAPLLTDDRMMLEFSAPRELHASGAGENGAALAALLGEDGGPAVIRSARRSTRATDWGQRGAMMSRRDAHAIAYDDYVRALQFDTADAGALDGLVRTAILTGRGSDALAWIKSLTASRTLTPRTLIATSKLLAAVGATADAIEAARQASVIVPVDPLAVEQVASLHADAGDGPRLDQALAQLRQIAPDAAPTHYYEGVAALLRDRPEDAVRAAERAIAADANYAPVYDLLGAAQTKLGRAVEARAAFARSLSFDPHDSTAYTNLGLLELAEQNRPAAARYFAEALWLAPTSPVAREGLTRAQPR